MALKKSSFFVALFALMTSVAVMEAQEFVPLQSDDDMAEMLGETPAKSKTKPAAKATEETEEEEPGFMVTGTVRIIRSVPETEVFFKDIKESYIIPKNSQHNKIFEACLQSSKTGKPVALRVDKTSRRVLSLADSTKSGSSLGPGSNSESQKGNK